MATATFDRLYCGNPTSSGPLYTLPALSKARVAHVACSNSGAVDGTFTLTLVTGTGTHYIADNLPVPAHDAVDINLSLIMDIGGDALVGVVSAAELNIAISGVVLA